MVKQRTSMKPIVAFWGWLYGNPDDKPLLRSLGVKGDMTWKPSNNVGHFTPGAETKTGIFEFCIITMEIAKALRDNYDVFWPGCFTAVDENNNQTVDQPLWSGIYYD